MVTKQNISHWITDAIALSYEVCGMALVLGVGLALLGEWHLLRLLPRVCPCMRFVLQQDVIITHVFKIL